MRIHSKFKDYYDTALGYGIDEDIHYVRETQEFEAKAGNRVEGDCLAVYANPYNINAYMMKDEYKRGPEEVDIGAGQVLFCGKLYSYIVMHFMGEAEHRYLWNYKDFAANYYPLLKDAFAKKLPNKFVKTMQAYFIPVENRKFADIHHNTGVPVIHNTPVLYRWRYGGTSNVIYNPCLKDIEFYKVLDPFTCFQELSMFIGGVLGGHSPKMVTISDEMKVYKHGFDPVYGFRTRKKQ